MEALVAESERCGLDARGQIGAAAASDGGTQLASRGVVSKNFDRVEFRRFSGRNSMVSEVTKYPLRIGDTQTLTAQQETSTACLDLYIM